MSAVNVDDLLRKLRELKPVILARCRATEIGLFGSCARGDQGPDSDIDVLVGFEEDADLFDLMGLSIYLEEKLQRKVDVVPKRALRAEIRDSVLRETVVV